MGLGSDLSGETLNSHLYLLVPPVVYIKMGQMVGFADIAVSLWISRKEVGSLVPSSLI